MWNPEGISKRSGKGGKPVLWLSMLSIPRHFQRLPFYYEVNAEYDQLTKTAFTMGQIAAEILLQKIISDRPLPELITVEPEIVTNTPPGT